MADRDIWDYQERGPRGWERGLLCVSAHEEGVLFEVEEEKAVDSYNQTFNCTCTVPWSEIDGLIEMLERVKASAAQSLTPPL